MSNNLLDWLDFIKKRAKSPNYILQTSREYSLYVNSTRGIPKIQDGLKDAARKALWVIRTRPDKIKTFSLGGAMIEQNLYLHGDASSAINSLAGPYVNNIPLLEGEGNFGKRVARDAFGASRYTYVKRPSYANDLVYVDLDIVPLEENYDGSNRQPIHFLPLIPLVLLNGADGMGVGWNTTIFPRDPIKLIDAVVAVIDGKPVKGLEPRFTWCDNEVRFVEINNNGNQVWEFTGKVRIEDTSTAVVTDLPWDLSLEKFKEILVGLEEKEIIKDFKDDSSAEIRIVVTFKRGSLKDKTEEDLINLLKLRQRRTENVVLFGWEGESIRSYKMVDDVSPAEQILREFVQWRFGWYETRYRKRIADDLYDLAFWKGIHACFHAGFPSKLPKLKDKTAVESTILAICSEIGELRPDESQVDRIASLPSYRWTAEGLAQASQKIDELEKRIEDYRDILSNEERRWSIFKAEVLDLKKKLKSILK